MTTNGDSDAGDMRNVENNNQQKNKVECANCTKIKAAWREHCRKEVEKEGNKLKQKHEDEKKVLHKEIESLKKELQSIKGEKCGITNDNEEEQRVRTLLEDNKKYRRQSEEIINELMAELKKLNKSKIDIYCQTDTVEQVTQMGKEICIDAHIQTMTEITNKKKELDEAIENIMQIKPITYRQIAAECPTPHQMVVNENEQSPSNAKRVDDQFEDGNDSDASCDSDIQIIESEPDQIDNNMDVDDGDGKVLPGQLKQRTISGKENDVADKNVDHSGQSIQEYLKTRSNANNPDDDNNMSYGKIMARFGKYLVDRGHDPKVISGELVVNDYLHSIADNNSMLQRLEELYKEGLLHELKKLKDKQNNKDAE